LHSRDLRLLHQLLRWRLLLLTPSILPLPLLARQQRRLLLLLPLLPSPQGSLQLRQRRVTELRWLVVR
jgi:hypothetical protein